MTLDDLTQLQKIAIEGEVSKALATARHNPEVLYRLYVMLKNAPKDICPYVVEVVKSITEIDRTDLDRVLLEVSSTEVPLWIWVKRTIADLKLSLMFAAADSMANVADTDRREIQKRIIKSAFVHFCRSTMMLSTVAVKELCQTIIDEEPLTLDFLQDVCFIMINEMAEMSEVGEVNETLFHSVFSTQDMLNFRFEKEVLEKKGVKAGGKRKAKSDKYAIKEPETPEEEEYLSKAISDAVTKVVKKYEKGKKFAVVKRYEGSKVSTVLKCYENKEKAEEFIKTVKEEYPELLKSCTLTIVPVNDLK